MKLNLGCGHRKLDGWRNVDRVPACAPDEVVDLERLPWPWADDSVEEVLLSHVLEHLGAAADVYLGIMKELYRVCRPGARITIIVPHPRSDHFLWDPTHVRPITVEGLQMFNQELNRQWVAGGYANTPLGLYLGIDFRVASVEYTPDPFWQSKLDRGELAPEAIAPLMKTHNNVIEKITVVIQPHKSPAKAVAGDDTTRDP